MKPTRYGIIGLGVQGKLYLALLTGQPWRGNVFPPCPDNLTLTAVSTRNPAVLEECCAGLPEVKGFTDWKEMICSGCIDAVIITVPHYQHPDIAIFALEHGVSVLCEKPAAVQSSQVQRMNEAAARHPELGYGLIFQQRSNPLYQHLHDLIASGELGELRRSNWILNTWWRPDSYYRSSPWRSSWRTEGGGVLSNQAPHQLDLWLWMCGLPTEVYSMCRFGAFRDIPVENDVSLLVRYANGATGCFITCTHDLSGTDRLELNFSKGQIIVERGRTAIVRRYLHEEDWYNQRLSMGEQVAIYRDHPEELYTEEALSFPGGVFGQEYWNIFSNFADHLQTGAPLIAPGAEGLWSVDMANAALLSAWKDQPQPYPCDAAEYDAILAQKIEEEQK